MNSEFLLIIPVIFFAFFIILSLYNKKCKKIYNKKTCPKTCITKYNYENFQYPEQNKENFQENFNLAVNNSCRSMALLCPTGYFCPTTGLTGPHICPIGSYCPSYGLSAAKPCNSGYYCNTTGITSQIICPTGSFCQTTTGAPVSCTGGYYCPAGSIVQNQCALGFHFEKREQLYLNQLLFFLD